MRLLIKVGGSEIEVIIYNLKDLRRGSRLKESLESLIHSLLQPLLLDFFRFLAQRV